MNQQKVNEFIVELQAIREQLKSPNMEFFENATNEQIRSLANILSNVSHSVDKLIEVIIKYNEQ